MCGCTSCAHTACFQNNNSIMAKKTQLHTCTCTCNSQCRLHSMQASGVWIRNRALQVLHDIVYVKSHTCTHIQMNGCVESIIQTWQYNIILWKLINIFLGTCRWVLQWHCYWCEVSYVNFWSADTNMGLSAGSLDILTTESRRGGIRSLGRSNLRASSKPWILSFHSWRAVGKKRK